MGSEIAGVVLETGPGVTRFAAGDHVFGISDGGFGPVAVADEAALVRKPADWSFALAASVPVAFLTAWHALVELAGARAGQRLLVHAAAGGVGMAAVAIGQYLGLEVYGTAAPAKHGVLAGRGVDAAHVASSRTREFEQQFLAATSGAGMDIVLNSLAGDLTDASLSMLPRGGMFIEMGATDVRDPDRVASEQPGVRYRALGQDRVQLRPGETLARVTGLLAAGKLAMPPLRAWDIRRAAEAFRFMSLARHTGKLALTIPPDPAAPRVAGSVLITGGTGTLGGLVARHLVRSGRASRLLLLSRSGPAAGGAAALAADLADGGAAVRIAAVDTANRDALAGVMAGHPLSAVVHTAGVLDDGTIASLTEARIAAVMRPKADTAWHLHELTQGMDLAEFVLFSSAASAFGGPGQGNYAAANAFLDGLACFRRLAGLPAVSLAWGLWADTSGMTSQLSTGGLNRMSRGGARALSAGQALALLDAAGQRDEPVLVSTSRPCAPRPPRAHRYRLCCAIWWARSARPQLAASPGPGRC
jgi:NADPH:quinone reductase-like Zn-dependent oxidoreductase